MWLDMNILVIPTNDWMRAPGHGHIDFIAEKLAERGHKVYAWHFDLYRNEQIKRKPRKVKLVKSKTLWIRDPALFFTLNALIQSPAMFKAMRDLKINVVINENILNGLVAFLVSNTRVLKVFDFSDYFPESASIFYTDSSPIMKKLVEVVALAVTKLNIKLAHVCLAVCPSLIKITRNMDKTKACYLLTNGVDMSTLFSQKYEIEQRIDSNTSEGILLIMGVIDEWLDLITPLEALQVLGNKFPDLKVVIIGPWRKKEHRKRIQDYIDSRGINSRVEITGYLSNQQLTRYLSRASCCIMPYKTDSFSSIIRLPEKLFVYSAFGKPILSTLLPEVIALKCEHVFFYQNANELASTVSTILGDENIRAKLSVEAKKFAEKHDLEVLAKNLEQILLASLPGCR
jgi:glycosyltransferase involved in cell wall biosynthesis